MLLFSIEPVLLALVALVWLVLAGKAAPNAAPATVLAPGAARRYEPPARMLLGRWRSGGRSDREAKAVYRAIAARITADAHPTAAIFLVGPDLAEAFAAHRPPAVPVHSLPQGGTHPAAVRLEMAALTAPLERVYAIYGRDAQASDPQQAVERYLDVYAFKISEEILGEARFAVYEVGFKTPVVAVSSGSRFAGLDGETITLVEYSIWPETTRPGRPAHVRLVWAADRTPARRYGVLIQLLDGAGRVVAERSSETEGGRRPATGWGAGMVVVDGSGVLLPPDLPPGEYALRLGLFAFDTNDRLAAAGADGVELGRIAVR